MSNYLITPAELNSRLKDPGTIVLDATLPPVGVEPKVDTKAAYLQRHIPGATFFDIDELSDKSTTLPHMMPSERDFSRAMSAAGVNQDMFIVVYEQTGVFSAARAWWMLRAFGAQDVYVLNGGLNAWVEAGYTTHSGIVRCNVARFQAKLDPSFLVDFDHLQQGIHDKVQILDARAKGRFDGTAPEPRPGLSSGHMPGATSFPYTDLVQDGKLKPKDDLKHLFKDRNIDIKKPIITTCGSGVTAAVLALGLAEVGAKHVRLYDGSWAEYAQHPNAKIEIAG